jgi:hypothetical protein
MEIILKGLELDCVKFFAKSFEEGHIEFHGYDPSAIGIQGLTRENCASIFNLLETCGVFAEARYSLDGDYYLQIGPRSLLLARQIEEKEAASKEGKDVVESIKLTLKKHPVTAWCFILFTIITASAVGLHNIMEVLRDFGAIPKK